MTWGWSERHQPGASPLGGRPDRMARSTRPLRVVRFSANTGLTLPLECRIPVKLAVKVRLRLPYCAADQRGAAHMQGHKGQHVGTTVATLAAAIAVAAFSAALPPAAQAKGGRQLMERCVDHDL